MWSRLRKQNCSCSLWHRCCWRSAATSVHCTKIVYTVQKYSGGWASLSTETCRANSNRSIKRSINGNCCILLLAYIAVLMMHGLTNVNICHDCASWPTKDLFSPCPLYLFKISGFLSGSSLSCDLLLTARLHLWAEIVMQRIRLQHPGTSELTYS